MNSPSLPCVLFMQFPDLQQVVTLIGVLFILLETFNKHTSQPFTTAYLLSMYILFLEVGWNCLYLEPNENEFEVCPNHSNPPPTTTQFSQFLTLYLLLRSSLDASLFLYTLKNFYDLFSTALSLRCCTWAFSSCGAWTSHYGGFSCWGAWAPGCSGSVTVACGLSCFPH